MQQIHLAAMMYLSTASSSAAEIPAFQAIPGTTRCQSFPETSDGIIGS
jgi:hypothetical protein